MVDQDESVASTAEHQPVQEQVSYLSIGQSFKGGPGVEHGNHSSCSLIKPSRKCDFKLTDPTKLMERPVSIMKIVRSQWLLPRWLTKMSLLQALLNTSLCRNKTPILLSCQERLTKRSLSTVLLITSQCKDKAGDQQILVTQEGDQILTEDQDQVPRDQQTHGTQEGDQLTPGGQDLVSGDQQIPGMQEGDQFNPGTEADQLKQMLEELQDVVFEISDISPKKAKVMDICSGSEDKVSEDEENVKAKVMDFCSGSEDEVSEVEESVKAKVMNICSGSED